MPTDRETARRNVERLHEHIKAVESGEISEDAPFSFAPLTIPPEEPVVDDRPWWFGPDWQPTKVGEVTVTVEPENEP